MRLIDADKVITLLEENANVSKEPLLLQVNNIRLIKKMQTVYDIDKVVQKLEELKQFYENRMSEMGGTDRDVEDAAARGEIPWLGEEE